jgi:hypothetical protein
MVQYNNGTGLLTNRDSLGGKSGYNKTKVQSFYLIDIVWEENKGTIQQRYRVFN